MQKISTFIKYTTNYDQIHNIKYRHFEVSNDKLRIHYAEYSKYILVIVLIESNEYLIKKVEELKR